MLHWGSRVVLQVALVPSGIRSVGRLADEVAKWVVRIMECRQTVPKNTYARRPKHARLHGGSKGSGLHLQGVGFHSGLNGGSTRGGPNVWAYLAW